jgi:Domain of unknown function (DUF4136)
MPTARLIVVSLALLLVAACASSFKAEVTRFNALAAPGGQTVRIVPAEGLANDMEFKSYAAIVARHLEQQGYTIAFSGEPDLIATVGYGSAPDPAYRAGPGLSLGLGVGSFGSHVGGGVGASVPVSGGRGGFSLEMLTLALTDRASGASVFEGRASGHGKDTGPQAAVEKLTEALFRDFPGQSGETITVTLKD